MDREYKNFKRRKSLNTVILVPKSVRAFIQLQNFVVVLTRVDKKWKPYQHDSEAMEMVLRFLDRNQGAVNREYWGECSSATPPQSVDLREDKKVNKLITSYDCQAITVSLKRKMYKKA